MLGDLYSLLRTFSKCLVPDLDRQKVGSDGSSLTLTVLMKEFLKVNFETKKLADDNKSMDNYMYV